MSIWISHQHIGWEMGDWLDEDGRAVPKTISGGDVRSYATGFSNHYPTNDDEVEQRACVDLAHIPAYCVPGQPDDDFENVGRWLRLGVDSTRHAWSDPCDKSKMEPEQSSVVMSVEAVRELRDQLTQWLERGKVHPAQ